MLTLHNPVRREPEPLALSTLNPNLVAAEYAVRGAIAIKSATYQQQLKEGKELPFDKVYQCNIGNPQILGQKSMTFFRQVLSLCEYPALLDHPASKEIYPPDVIERARLYLSSIPGGVGAYSESKGAVILRQHVAHGIERRDGHPCDIDNLWLTDGASPAVHYMMKALLRNENDCILCPIPQYPLYSATIKLYGGTLLPYFLEESQGWQATLKHLQEQVDAARSQGKQVRALVVINPGNPTGQVLDRQNQETLIRFCAKEKLILMADEVYQTNIYAAGKSFFSFKKVLMEMGPELASSVALVSMNSISKGFFGECGRRGGYFEAVNFPQPVKDQLYKLASISLCPNLSGQICMALIMNPPQPGDPSFELFASEREAILESLKRRAKLLVDTFRGMEGVQCNEVEGSMYAFPRLTMPAGARDEAAKEGKQPDFLYCMELLDQTGIVTVPGSGFGQEPGTYHVRTTILPPEADMAKVATKFSEFHKAFMQRYEQNGARQNGSA
ncbi:alanine aminotransferase 2 [Micractinium conductrix]|uniref:Alanine aminotransferase 2 n=1 Tax=Micractinium conductrix TaxID=554055 RepID=A0A2P6V4B3_9CHLO|nr:alanine aminotransferase 2 [Micractinium conductrix]|eukprot:PSC68925.1 alanine aminotransferase 2 [Micractinium conductrix]